MSVMPDRFNSTSAPSGVRLLGEPRRYPERIAELEEENRKLRAAVDALSDLAVEATKTAARFVLGRMT